MTQSTQPTQPKRRATNTGRMTAVMRSAMATGPKVLRIGMVQEERVVDERIIRDRSNVSVGSNEKNTFVVGGAAVPPALRLFERTGDRYALNFLDGMQGRIALPTGINDLQALKGQARRTQQGAYQIPLTEDSRGKLTIGDTTFLFQFVAPPPVQPKPQLPVSVMQGASHLDWTTTIIAAFVFLFDFLLIGAIYSDWFDQVIDENLSVSAILSTVRNLPPPPPVEVVPEEGDVDAEAEEDAPAAAKSSKASSSKGPGPTAAEQQQAKMAAALDALAESDALQASAISAAVDTGAVSDGLLTSGDVPINSLDAAAKSGSGVMAGGAGLRKPGGGGPVTPGMAGGGLAGVGQTGKTGGTGTGVAKKVKGPKGRATIGGTRSAGGSINGADAAIARLRPRFRRCYENGLNQNPDISGKITLKVRIGLSGKVESVTSSVSGQLPASVVSCVTNAVKARSFPPPQGSATVLTVPVNFVKQD